MHARTQLCICVAIVALVVAVYIAEKRRRQRENFSFSKIFNKVKNVAVGAFNTVKSVATGGGPSQPAYAPQFVGRQWDGIGWSCPDGTVDTGREDYQACAKSQYMTPLWRNDGKQWGWSCPNGTVPSGLPTWEQQCEVGWTARQYYDGKWQCPPGMWDSGATWDNSDYYAAQKQCQLKSAYTTRVWDGAAWVCPTGTKDTGVSWDKGEAVGGKQCKWIGG